MTEAIKKSILFVVSAVAYAGLRFAYHLRCPQIADDFGYFERAMIQTKEQSIAATGSGLVNAYIGALSGLFRFVGNRIEAVWGYQMMMQGTAIVLLVIGCYLLFGKLAAYLCAAVSAVLPYLIVSLTNVSPENFFLLCYASIFLMVGILTEAFKKCEWFPKQREILPPFIGFLSGFLCVCYGVYLSIPVKTTLIGNILRQEIDFRICIYLGGMIVMSGLFGLFAKKKIAKNADVAELVDKTIETSVSSEEVKVAYLENPLPVPKKHEKRTMDFDMEGNADDFDIQIDEKDDFDV